MVLQDGGGLERTVTWWDLPLKTILPPIFYIVMFFVLSPHLPSRFFTHFADGGAGFQTYWDMWWMQKAIIDLHQSPYFTTYLHYPYGTTLVAQTLHPFNGLVSLFLPFLSVGQAYNVMVVAGFALGGWTAFLLCRKVSGSYWSSLVGGAVFTFSSYHFAHAEGALAEEEALDLGAARLAEAAARDIPSEALRSKDRKTIIPSLHGALLKNEQDVHLFERLVFMTRAKGA